MKFAYVCMIGAVILISGCESGHARKRPDTQNVPLYPGAQQVMHRDRDLFERVTLFQTDDPPDSVIAWYKDVLVEAGWTLRMEYPDALDFGYSGSSREAAYNLAVVVASVQDGRTSVEVRLRKEPPL